MSTSPTPPELLVVGRVRRAHGIRGEVVVEYITDEPDAVFAPGRRVFAGTTGGAPARDGQELHVEQSSPFKGGFIVKFREIVDRSAAETWRDRYLLLPSAELPPPDEGEVYVHDLPGMRVVRVSGEPIGEVVEVFELPQGLVLEVRVEPPRTGTVMVPFDERTVTAVDGESRVITIDPIEGLLD
ncbi:MAG TPA: ribosome maturation factor RimM [Gemmatimonadaceae bacterium]|nr:ribosome maturation factor RimM [Gemmatimonadaceae bacterium]